MPIEEICAERDRRALLVAHLPRAPAVAEAAAAAEPIIVVIMSQSEQNEK